MKSHFIERLESTQRVGICMFRTTYAMYTTCTKGYSTHIYMKLEDGAKLIIIQSLCHAPNHRFPLRKFHGETL
jgi:hypothetical protein